MQTSCFVCSSLCFQVQLTSLSSIACVCTPAFMSLDSKFVCVSLARVSLSQLLAYISTSMSAHPFNRLYICIRVYVGLGGGPRSPRAWRSSEPSPSLDMPTSKHFCSRQYWQRLRVTLLIWQFLSRWQVYTMFF